MTRDDEILDAAIALTKQRGLFGFTPRQIAEHVGMSRPTVCNYGLRSLTKNPQPTAGVLGRIQNDVASRAVSSGDLSLLAACIAARHPIALAAPDSLRIAAVATLS